MDMLEKITKIIRDYKGDPDLAVAAQSTFEELELDSLDTVELVMSLEEEFSVTIEMDDDIKTIADLIKIIEGLQATV
jgi:acyl carrier protein